MVMMIMTSTFLEELQKDEGFSKRNNKHFRFFIDTVSKRVTFANLVQLMFPMKVCTVSLCRLANSYYT